MIANAATPTSVKVWDLACDRCVQTLHGHTNCCQEFSDGRAAVSGEHNNRIVPVWDLYTGEQSARTQPEQRFNSKCALAPKSGEPVDRDDRTRHT